MTCQIITWKVTEYRKEHAVECKMVGMRSVEIHKDAIRRQMIRIFRSLGVLELENTQELLWTVYLVPLQFQRDDSKEFIFFCFLFFNRVT